jgi:FkbM family methyltransferase
VKNVAKSILSRLGYRLVPRNRDPLTFRSYLAKLPINTVIDVGANRGDTCSDWLRLFPHARVHAIEALDRYQLPLKAIAASSGGRMDVWQCAASDELGEVIFHEHSDHPSSSSLLRSTPWSHELLPFTKLDRSLRVDAIPIDTLFEQYEINLAADVFIKLDVQGAEAKVLRGATETLKKTRAVLTEINLHDLYYGQATLEEIINILSLNNLKFSGIFEQFHDTSDRPIYIDALFLKE